MILNCYNIASQEVNTLDIMFKIAAIIIAIVNLILLIYFFRINTKNSNENTKKDRKLLRLKTLILDHNLKYLYDFFEKIEIELSNLKLPNLDDNRKKEIVEVTDDLFIGFRRKFINTLLAIDDQLYSDILEKADNLQESINNNTFDNGINLAHLPMFNQRLLDPITNAKTEILKHLFNFEE